MANEERVLAAARSCGEGHLADAIREMSIDVRPVSDAQGRTYGMVRPETTTRVHLVRVRVEPTGDTHAQFYARQSVPS